MSVQKKRVQTLHCSNGEAITTILSRAHRSIFQGCYCCCIHMILLRLTSFLVERATRLQTQSRALFTQRLNSNDVTKAFSKLPLLISSKQRYGITLQLHWTGLDGESLSIHRIQLRLYRHLLDCRASPSLEGWRGNAFIDLRMYNFATLCNDTPSGILSIWTI